MFWHRQFFLAIFRSITSYKTSQTLRKISTEFKKELRAFETSIMEYCQRTNTEILGKWFFDWGCSLIFTLLVQLVIFMSTQENRLIAALFLRATYEQVSRALETLLRPIAWPASFFRINLGLVDEARQRENHLEMTIKREIEEQCSPRFIVAYCRLQVRNLRIPKSEKDHLRGRSISNLFWYRPQTLRGFHNRAFCALSGLPILANSDRDEIIERLDIYDELMVSFAVKQIAVRLDHVKELKSLRARGRILLRDDLDRFKMSSYWRWVLYGNML